MAQPVDGSSLPTLHLVRHGQSTWNLEHRVQGQRNAPELTDLGRQQASTRGRGTVAARPVRLLTSDLTRAVQTAEIIGRAVGLTPIATPLLREQALGELEGLTTRQATARLAGVDLTDPAVRYARRGIPARRGRQDRGHCSPRPLVGRRSAPTDEIVLVSHGDTIRIAIAVLLGEDQTTAPWRTIDNGSVTTIRAVTGRIGRRP